jgi:CheY-like chemotaxis protein
MSETILLVEDDSALRFLGLKQCKALKLTVDTATNGVEAVAKAADDYALILMDLAMPEMNGIEAASRIREQELRSGRKRTPIIAMSAYAEREQALAAGIDDYLQKPVLLEGLKEIVLTWAPHLLHSDI